MERDEVMVIKKVIRCVYMHNYPSYRRQTDIICLIVTCFAGVSWICTYALEERGRNIRPPTRTQDNACGINGKEPATSRIMLRVIGCTPDTNTWKMSANQKFFLLHTVFTVYAREYMINMNIFNPRCDAYWRTKPSPVSQPPFVHRPSFYLCHTR